RQTRPGRHRIGARRASGHRRDHQDHGPVGTAPRPLAILSCRTNDGVFRRGGRRFLHYRAARQRHRRRTAMRPTGYAVMHIDQAPYREAGRRWIAFAILSAAAALTIGFIRILFGVDFTDEPFYITLAL